MHFGNKITFIFLLSILNFFSFTTGEKKCQPLIGSQVENGHLKRWSSNKLQVICNRNYIVHGSSVLYCYNGKWSNNKLPQCSLRSRFCSDPGTIRNGKRIGTRQHIGAKIKYRCNAGYTLVGSEHQLCKSSKRWYPEKPKCLSEKQILDLDSIRFKEQFVQHLKVQESEPGIGARILGPDVNRIGLDLTFLIDRSSSIDPFDFNIAKNFIKALINEFGIKNGKNIKGNTRVAVITFGDDAKIIFNVDDSSINSVKEANKRLDGIQPDGGSTNIEKALSKVTVRVRTRAEVKKALFIMSDGKPNAGRENSPEELCRNLKRNAGYEIFTLGIGKNVNTTFLKAIASSPISNHYFYLNKFSDFNRLLWFIRNEAKSAPPPSLNQCGYIGDGQYQWPWLVTIWAEIPIGNSFSFKQCTGVIICRKWILTASHCFYYYERRFQKKITRAFVTIGQKDILNWHKNAENIIVENIITHELFNATSLENDIALVKLRDEVPLKEDVKMICLPRPEIQLSRRHTQKFSIVGFGNSYDELYDKSPILNKQFKMQDHLLLMLPKKSCIRRSKDLSCNTPTNSHFCSETKTNNVSFCTPGTGSPSITIDDMENDQYKRHRVIGILSSNCQCQRQNGFSFFTRIYNYLDWIKAKSSACTEEHK